MTCPDLLLLLLFLMIFAFLKHMESASRWNICTSSLVLTDSQTTDSETTQIQQTERINQHQQQQQTAVVFVLNKRQILPISL